MAPDGSTVFKTFTDFVPKAYGSPWYLCHRVDLHNELKHLAFGDEGEGTPAKLHLSSKVEKIDHESGEITLVSGEVFKGDLIVGADGIHVNTPSSGPGSPLTKT
jgi:salicylate hydroxylase